MRLDHLLSKERPTRPFGGWVMVARIIRVWWWGAQVAETLASSLIFLVILVCLVLPPFLWGVERWRVVGVGVGEASCWVLRQQTRVWGLGFRCVAVPYCPPNQSIIVWVLVVGVGVGVARCLRITQWTRASLWSSC